MIHFDHCIMRQEKKNRSEISCKTYDFRLLEIWLRRYRWCCMSLVHFCCSEYRPVSKRQYFFFVFVKFHFNVRRVIVLSWKLNHLLTTPNSWCLPPGKRIHTFIIHTEKKINENSKIKLLQDPCTHWTTLPNQTIIDRGWSLYWI